MSGPVTSTILRTTGYALTNLFALSTGYLLHKGGLFEPDALLAIALWLVALPFFLDYSLSYYQPSVFQSSDETLSDAKTLLPVIAGALTIIMILLYRLESGGWPEFWYWIMLIAFALAFNLYGHHLASRSKEGQERSIRHQLVWPVILSIAVPLYVGRFFVVSPADPSLFLPLLIVLAIFLATNTLQKIGFLLSTLLPVIFVVTINIFDLGRYFSDFWAHFSSDISNLALYIGIAGYLAVFEAWRLVASEAHATKTSSGQEVRGRTLDYFLGTSLALIIAWLSLPIMYIFGSLGRIFILGVIFHGAVAFSFWFAVGGNSHHLRTRNWVLWKNLYGFSFLTLLVLDGWFLDQPTRRFLASFVEIDWWAWSLGIVGAVITVVAFFEGKESVLRWGEKLRQDRRFLLLGVTALSLFYSLGILIAEGVERHYENANPAVLGKADRSFIFYLIMTVLSILAFLWYSKKDMSRKPVPTIASLLLSSRFWTSSLIMFLTSLAAWTAGATIWGIIGASLPLGLAAAGGFALNDYMDWKRDAINKPHRVIPSGQASRPTVGIWAVSILFASLVSAILAPIPDDVRGLQLLAIGGVSIYSWCAVQYPLFKPWLGATISLIPMAVIVRLVDYGSLESLVLLAGLLFLASREYQMDILDSMGDAATGVRTLPVRFGKRVAIWVFRGLMLASSLLMVFIAHNATQALYRYIFTFAAVCAVVLVAAWSRVGEKGRRRIVVVEWIPMTLAILGVL